jgi:Flp pilus assembly protein TadD
MFLAIEDSEHATQCLLHAVGLDMRNADAYHYLGVSAANKGQLVDAERFLDHALELNPNHTAALRDSAYTYLADNQPAVATAQIARARALLPHDCELRMLDHSVRLLLLVGRLARVLRRLDPRTLLRRRTS